MAKTPNKKFSFIIPVYKSEKFLKDTLDAIEDQDYKEREVIIVTNKDNKEVPKIIKKYKTGRLPWEFRNEAMVCRWEK
jgi:glycosyltransferase involved in cell wall biosynthesis